MSGTIAKKQKQALQLEQQRRRLRNQALKAEMLRVNREEVIAEVCAMFGWKELDPFAKDMLDKAFAGKTVNVKQLKKDLAAWKDSQSAPVEEPDEAPTAEETEVVSDDQHL